VKKRILFSVLIILAIFLSLSFKANLDLKKTYANNESAQVFDRNNNIISIIPNNQGYYCLHEDNIPEIFKEILIKKEDQYFYAHPGFNPISIISDILSEIGLSQRNGASTISQQLAKILLQNENNRNLGNKTKELFYTIALEIFNSKDDILLMYINTIYLGNQLQGINIASQAYFDMDAQTLSKEQAFQLVSSINSPNENNPNKEENKEHTIMLSKKLSIDINQNGLIDKKVISKNLTDFKQNNIPPIEIKNCLSSYKTNKLTLDLGLNKKIRESIKANLEKLETKKAKNAAAIVISLPQNEVISMIGSPDPLYQKDGYQINMLEEPRQVGSTMKPFIYLKAFEKGMRPYTLINDTEYRYTLEDSSPFYPQNYDYTFNGEITAHYALSNSINLAAVKTLEFAGINNFNDFITQDLEQSTVQDIETYGLGIALGAFELNLIDLAHLFTIFPNNGTYKELLFNYNQIQAQDKIVSQKAYIELINKILSDRKISIDQFGANSKLILEQKNYALKTGTSQNYKDSLIVGYTPDFLVAVWVGNADASETEGLSGQLGAGYIWHDIMETMFNSEYNHKTNFDFSSIIMINNEYGLASDNFEETQNLLKQDMLILNPHDQDVFLFDLNSAIKLKSSEDCIWFINDKPFEEDFFTPQEIGTYKITAKTEEKEETVYIFIQQ
jgi:penicillin-binding protein 1C